MYAGTGEGEERCLREEGECLYEGLGSEGVGVGIGVL
jgi:hypothetical protein